jgi:hypothetical protein
VGGHDPGGVLPRPRRQPGGVHGVLRTGLRPIIARRIMKCALKLARRSPTI